MIEEANYSSENYITSSKLSELDVYRYYIKLGYKVYSENIKSRKGLMYSKRIKKGQLINNNAIKNLFEEYNSGYPDLLLIKGNEISFVEIKLDGDGIQPNQAVFLHELGKIADVKVIYFNYYDTSLKIESNLRGFPKDVHYTCRRYEKIRKKRSYKQLWIIATLYNKYKDDMLKEDILDIVAIETRISKEKIRSFVEYIKGNVEVEIKVKGNAVLTIDEQKKLDKIKNKKVKLLREHDIYDYPDWVRSLTFAELLHKLNEDAKNQFK